MKPWVLLTSFEPFDQRKENGSHSVASELKRQFDSQTQDFELMWLSHVPVLYDEAARQVGRTLEARETRPTFVIALGEGGDDVRVEVCANNLDHSKLPDNQGEIRTQKQIDEKEGERIGFYFPHIELFEFVKRQSSNGVRYSISPGHFVCNNLSFHLTQHLTSKKIPFTFVHVPRADRPAKLAFPHVVRFLHTFITQSWLEIVNFRGPIERVEAKPLLLRERLARTTHFRKNEFDFYQNVLTLLEGHDPSKDE